MNKSTHRFTASLQSSFSKLFSFSGRTNRYDFFALNLFVFELGTLIFYMSGFIASLFATTAAQSNGIKAVFLTTYSLVFFLPYLAIAARRLHDIGKSGWWQLLLITGIGGLVVFYWCCKQSAPDNKYGALLNHPETGLILMPISVAIFVVQMLITIGVFIYKLG